MKICSTCKIKKPESEFDFKNKAEGIRHVRCKPCQREYGRQHYLLNTDKYKNRIKRLRDGYYAEVRRMKEQPCADCGQRFPYFVMDFDHVGKKTDSVSRLTYQAAIRRVRHEVKVCEVVCANCHRIRTHQRRLLKIRD